MSKSIIGDPKQELRRIEHLRDHGQIAEALDCATAYWVAHPSDVAGARLCAELHFRLGQRDQGFRSAVQAFALDPTDVTYGLDCAFNLVRDGRRDTALEISGLIARQESQNPSFRDALGTLFTYCEEPREALPHFAFACAAEPDCAQFRYNLASAQRMVGATQDADANLNHAVHLDPDNGQFQLARSALLRQTHEHNHVEHLLSGLRKPLSQKSRIFFNFAVAKELEDLGRYDEAFFHLSSGALSHRATLNYSLGAELAFLDRVAAADYAPARIVGEGSGARPIFVMGLPRSGTTLVERIIACVPGVASAGEVKALSAAIGQAARRMNAAGPQGGDPVAAMLSRSVEIIRSYRAAITRWSVAHSVIDKTPANYLFAGFIRAAFPDAKIICLRRNPMDSCYALYKTLFANDYPFTYDLGEIAQYYVHWNSLITKWEATLGDAWLTVQYEDLVREPEPMMRRIITHCDLPWDDRCLRFYDLGTPVTSASAGQVNRPLYADSVGMWKHYARELEPLANSLEAGGVSIER